jgi:hypothetical protein
LCDSDAVEGRGVGSVGKDGCGFGEFGDISDSGVLFIELCVYDLLLSSANGRENVWFSLVVTVCADTWRLSVWIERGFSIVVPRLIFSLKLSALKASVIPATRLEKAS